MAGTVEERTGLVDYQALERANFSGVDNGFHLVIAGVKAAVGTHVEDDLVFITGLDHAVGFLQRSGEGFFGIDRPGAGFGRGNDDLGAVLWLGGYADDLGFNVD